jgi:hypothetical protein
MCTIQIEQKQLSSVEDLNILVGSSNHQSIAIYLIQLQILGCNFRPSEWILRFWKICLMSK